MNFKAIIFLAIAVFFAGCSGQQVKSLKSPNGNIEVKFGIQNSQPCYSVCKNGVEVITPSALGFLLTGNDEFCCDFIIIGTCERSFDETWQQVWGEEIDVRNNYNELTVKLQEKNGKRRLLNIIFRAFDDGIGFRYQFPEQENLKEFEIAEELTEFSFAQDFDIWSQHLRDYDYEALYNRRKISEITDTVSTPVTIETADGGYILIHEAALIDYAAMNLTNSSANGRGVSSPFGGVRGGEKSRVGECRTALRTPLTAWQSGVKVYAKTPFETSWRFIVLAENLNDLANSRIMLNLNEPCKIEDTSWLKPTKYIGIWWGIHLQYQTWSMGAKHGATTENMLKYIDFAAANGFNGVLAEGWNIGWEHNCVTEGQNYRFYEPYPDFDIEKISEYAAKKGVKIIGHHETGGMITNYENQLDSAFIFAAKYGISSVKTGYVARLLDGKERHSSQYGVRHYRKVVETAAKYGVMIDCHEPIMPSGWQRTYPNLMSQEGVRGQEWDAWSADGGNPPEHTTIIPFTRGLAGGIDFTAGTFNFSNPVFPNTRVQTTIAKQLALYVVIYSPLVMASDVIENYANRPEFEFIKIVPVDWQKTIILDGKIGDFVITARKDRNSENWFVGAITDENARDIKIDFSFLDKNKKYRAKIYKDGANADWQTNPYSVEILEKDVDYQTTLDLHLATSGGAAVYIQELGIRS